MEETGLVPAGQVQFAVGLTPAVILHPAPESLDMAFIALPKGKKILDKHILLFEKLPQSGNGSPYLTIEMYAGDFQCYHYQHFIEQQPLQTFNYSVVSLGTDIAGIKVLCKTSYAPLKFLLEIEYQYEVVKDKTMLLNEKLDKLCGLLEGSKPPWVQLNSGMWYLSTISSKPELKPPSFAAVGVTAFHHIATGKQIPVAEIEQWVKKLDIGIFVTPDSGLASYALNHPEWAQEWVCVIETGNGGEDATPLLDCVKLLYNKS